MMSRTINAVFEDGIFKPLEPVELPDHQRVRLIVEREEDSAASCELAAWENVLDGMSENDIDEVQALATDRSHFMRREG